jgi:hypothetical protein
VDTNLILAIIILVHMVSVVHLYDLIEVVATRRILLLRLVLATFTVFSLIFAALSIVLPHFDFHQAAHEVLDRLLVGFAFDCVFIYKGDYASFKYLLSHDILAHV